MISIEAVVSGLACECVCPECAQPLVAAKGDVYRHHFRHHADQAVCWYAGETALHRFAKQLICETLELGYPRWHPGFGDEMFAVELGALRAAQSEVNLSDTGIRTDVLATFEREPVAVEIFVAHRVQADKVARFVQCGIAAIEIDLSHYPRASKDDAQWREAILHSAPRYWLNPPKMVRDAESAKRAQWIEQQRERERAMRAEHQRLEAERLALDRALQAMAENDARRREQQRLLDEAWAIERAAEQRVIVERERMQRERERFRSAAVTAALKQQHERERAVPNLQTLVLAHGTYSNIPAEAWAHHDDAVRRWNEQRLFGGAPPIIDELTHVYDDAPRVMEPA
jgi:hypothetical protein